MADKVTREIHLNEPISELVVAALKRIESETELGEDLATTEPQLLAILGDLSEQIGRWVIAEYAAMLIEEGIDLRVVFNPEPTTEP